MTFYGFETTDRDEATAALLVYAVWRSRDSRRFKITPGLWGQVRGFVKASGKRARTIGQFIERLMPRLCCDALKPRAMTVGVLGLSGLNHASAQHEHREFLTPVLAACDEKRVLRILRDETMLVILLVQTRLEAEKPLEATVVRALADDERAIVTFDLEAEAV